MKSRGRKSAAELALAGQSWLANEHDRPYPARYLPEPPGHLRQETQAWWASVVAAYEFQPHEYRSLLVACEAWDRKEQAREAISQHGLSYIDEKGMVRARPEVAIERDARTAFLRAVRELRLGEVEPPKFVGGVGLTYEQLQARG
jgi:phage terminase small subunit